MKRLLNSSVKQSILYGMSIALMKGVSLLILPFVTHQLTTAEYGRLEVIGTISIIGSILVGMGLEDTLFRFAGSTTNKQQRARIASEIFSLTILITVITLIIAWFVAAPIAAFTPGNPSTYEVRLVLSLIALEGCIAVPLGWLRMNNRALTFCITSTGRALLQAILVVIFLYLGRGVAGILEAGLISGITQTLLLGYLQLRDTGLHFNTERSKHSFIYSLPIMGSGLAAFALNGLDRWVLAEHATLADVAEYGIAAKFALATVLLLQPFGMWWSPRRFAVLNEPNGSEKVAHFISMGAGLALLLTVWVGLLSPTLINWLLPESYTNAGQYALGMVLIMLLKELVELFNIGCFTGRTTNIQFIINLVAAIIGIGAMILLTPEYKVWGIILSLLLAQFTRLLFFYKASQYFLPLNYPVASLITLMALSIIWLLISSQITSLGQLIVILFLATGSLLAAAQALKLIDLPIKTRKKSVSNE